MIILDDRGWTMQQMILKNKEQIQGSQTWLDDIPGGLHTRCHYYDGRFSVENYMEIGISPIGLAKSHAEKIFEERINLEELWNANVQGKYFSEEEWKNAGFTWDILEKICEYFYKHRTFYSKVLQIEGQNSFTEHFRDILVPVNRKFLAMVEEEEKGEHEEFYIHFFSTCNRNLFY